MGEYVATVTGKGQLTLPAAIRRRMGIDPGDRVAIVIEGENGARPRRIEHTIESVLGMIPAPSDLNSEDFDDAIEDAMGDHADFVLRRLREETR